MSWYFEIPDPKTGDPVYTVCYNRTGFQGVHLARQAHRVWEETESGVEFIKHRYLDPSTTTVDLEEFFWIKLKSQSID